MGEPAAPTDECANTGCPDGCYWASKTRGGVGLWVPQCKICGNIDWDAIAEQLVTIRGQAAYEAEEAKRRVARELDRTETAHDETLRGLIGVSEKLAIAKAKLTYQRQDFDRTLHEVMHAASTVIGRMEHELAVHYNAQCPNLSYYGRRCIQAPHSPAASCIFAPNEDSEWYDLQNGSTMAELLEALTAGGPIAVSAAMRWLEYRLHSDHADAVRTFGDHIVTQVKATALGIVQEEQKQVLRYLAERATEPA